MTLRGRQHDLPPHVGLSATGSTPRLSKIFSSFLAKSIEARQIHRNLISHQQKIPVVSDSSRPKIYKALKPFFARGGGCPVGAGAPGATSPRRDCGGGRAERQGRDGQEADWMRPRSARASDRCRARLLADALDGLETW